MGSVFLSLRNSWVAGRMIYSSNLVLVRRQSCSGREESWCFQGEMQSSTVDSVTVFIFLLINLFSYQQFFPSFQPKMLCEMHDLSLCSAGQCKGVNNFKMSMVGMARRGSVASLGHSSVRSVKERRFSKLAGRSVAVLTQFRKTYQHPFVVSRRQGEGQQPQEQQQGQGKRVVGKGQPREQQFQRRCRVICEQLCFNLGVFQKLYRQNHRKKSVLVKFYGWDSEFEEIFFIKNSEELHKDITAESLFDRLGFGVLSFDSRNACKKISLFLSEVVANNRKQQELQSRFMKVRLGNQLGKLDREMVEIAKDRERKGVRQYCQEIGNMHQYMLNTKLKIHNKRDTLELIERDTGRVTIRDFYAREERDIDEVEKYFTRIRLGDRL